MAVRKPFEQHLYDAYDNPAKTALVSILEARGHTMERVSENYYADVVSTFEGETYYSEAGVKLAWTDEWPSAWTDIRIPERKSRLIKKYNGNVTFYVFNKDVTQCWEIKGSDLSDQHIRSAFGRKIRSGEKFYHFPYKEATLVKV